MELQRDPRNHITNKHESGLFVMFSVISWIVFTLKGHARLKDLPRISVAEPSREKDGIACDFTGATPVPPAAGQCRTAAARLPGLLNRGVFCP